MNKPDLNAVMIAANRYRRHSYGGNHPLGIPRVSLTLDLIRAYGALSDDEFLQALKALPKQLEWFHTREYVSAMQRCEAVEKVFDKYRQRHNIGNFENPYFKDFFATPATATGASIQAAEVVLKGKIGFNPAGGMHHAMPDSAQGFCFFNDPVLGIMRLRQEGLRVLYVDIDVHHGDGVEAAFRDDPDVMTFSTHMDTEYAYPFKGGNIDDTGAHFNAVNLPLPQAVHDDEYSYCFTQIWPEVLAAFKPDAVVLQAGADMLRPDPLGKFTISTQCFLSTVERVVCDSPRHETNVPKLLVTGGGGYHPITLARCWTGVWAVISGRDLPNEIPPAGQALLRDVEWDMDEDEAYFDDLFTHRLDAPYHGEIRDEIKNRVAQLLESHPAFR